MVSKEMKCKGLKSIENSREIRKTEMRVLKFDSLIPCSYERAEKP